MNFQVLLVETVQGGSLNSGHCTSRAPENAHIADWKVQGCWHICSSSSSWRPQVLPQHEALLYNRPACSRNIQGDQLCVCCCRDAALCAQLAALQNTLLATQLMGAGSVPGEAQELQRHDSPDHGSPAPSAHKQPDHSCGTPRPPGHRSAAFRHCQAVGTARGSPA